MKSVFTRTTYLQMLSVPADATPALPSTAQIIPLPKPTVEEGIAVSGRQKLTVHLDEKLVNRVKNAAYWNPRLTIARIAEEGIRHAIDKIERENGGPYAQRESELVGGRPMK